MHQRAQEQTKQSQKNGSTSFRIARVELTHTKQQRGKKKKNLTHEDNRNLLDNVKQNNIHIIEVLEEEKRAEILFEEI